MMKARLSLLDWMVCGIAGKDEPLARKLRQFAEDEGGTAVASVIGGAKAPARMAALVNGATSHALDYDDTHFAHVGHLSVGIYPAAMAVAEETGALAAEMVEAFLVGAEAAVRIGVVLGAAHYNKGFHQTATAGAFGATVAAARLYGLDPAQSRAALGLCATRASGLKSQFGTMGKPYNAGIAASNGVECARLARLGFTSADDGLFDPQGFVPTHSDDTGTLPDQSRSLFEDNKYKFHACCHGTHAMIEGLQEIRRLVGGIGNVQAVTLRTSPRWLKVCDKKTPRTGLEVKFSYVWLAGMALRGDATGDERIYTDGLAADPELAQCAETVTVIGDASLNDLQAKGSVTLRDGREVAFAFDLDAPLSAELLKEKLTTKAQAAIGDQGLRIAEMIETIETAPASDFGAVLRAQ